MTETAYAKCPRCRGKGHVPTEHGEEGDVKNCPDCDGTGEPEDTDAIGWNGRMATVNKPNSYNIQES